MDDIKTYVSNVDEVISLLKGKAARLEGELQAAVARAEKAEKALNLIAQMSDPGDHWVAVCKMKSIAVDALTPKQSTDE